MLEIRGVAKGFGGGLGAVRALAGVHLSLQPGEFFSLLGPSGCGKTTLLRILGGFERPDAGQLVLDGRDITRLPPWERPFNLIFQRYALFPHLTVAENVGFGPSVRRVERAELRRRVDEALATVDMGGFAGRRIDTLSGGQQQRVAIARAIVNQPRILLLDEPLSALDLKLRQRMQVELRTLQRRLGMTFVFVTHAQDEALTLSDRMAVMNGGAVEQTGTPEEIYCRPATPFVASFIGTVNRIPGRVNDTEKPVLQPDQCAHLLHAGLDQRSERGRHGSRAMIIFRPEQAEVLPASGAVPIHLTNVIEARLDHVLYRGYERELILNATASPGRPLTVVSNGTSLPPPGSMVRVAWPGDSSLLMDEAELT